MKYLFTLIFLMGGLMAPLKADPPRVVVSLAPLHSLVSDLMDGVGAPSLLIAQEVSGHDYTLKPSQIRLLESADLVVWVGPPMEGFLQRLPFAKTSKSWSLFSLKGITAWPSRRACHGHTHACDDLDPHLCLSINNALVMVRALALWLKEKDPEHQTQYVANLARIEGKLKVLRLNLKNLLTPLQGKSFFVFHDAFQYLEKDFDLGPSLHLTLDPEQGLSLKHMRALRDEIQQHPGACLIAEKTLGEARVARLAQKLNLRYQLVDPMGFDEAVSRGLPYTQMMTSLARSFVQCVAPQEARP